MRRFAGSQGVRGAATAFTQAPGAIARQSDRSAAGPRPSPDGGRRFAGDRGLQIERERRIEQFRDDHANLRSKGYSPDAAAQQAMAGMESGERPQRSLRYQMLAGED